MMKAILTFTFSGCLFAIVHGEVIPESSSEYVVPVGIIDPSSGFSLICSGVLLHPRMVLTVSDCTSKKALSYAIGKTSETGSVTVAHIDATLPNFAILVLREALTNSLAVLASEKIASSLTRDQTVHIVGRGIAHIPIMMQGFPLPIKRSVKRRGYSSLVLSTEDTFLLSASTNGAQASLGDSGGAILARIPDDQRLRLHLIGLLKTQTHEDFSNAQSWGYSLLYNQLETLAVLQQVCENKQLSGCNFMPKVLQSSDTQEPLLTTDKTKSTMESSPPSPEASTTRFGKPKDDSRQALQLRLQDLGCSCQNNKRH